MIFEIACFSIIDDQTSLWHRGADHLHHNLLKHLEAHQLVKGFPRHSITKGPSPCGPCLQGKQAHVIHKVTNWVNRSRCLDVLQMDLVGHMQTKSLSGKYIFIIVDDYSRYTWVFFINHKSDTVKASLLKRMPLL